MREKPTKTSTSRRRQIGKNIHKNITFGIQRLFFDGLSFEIAFTFHFHWISRINWRDANHYELIQIENTDIPCLNLESNIPIDDTIFTSIKRTILVCENCAFDSNLRKKIECQ